MARYSAIATLTVSFGLWWTLWLTTWFSRLEHPSFALLAPVLPAYYGVVFLSHRDLDMALASLGISALTFILMALTILTGGSRPLLIGAHVCLCLYWLWSFGLVAMSV
jgi:hypothetical protein